jgi:hypothetical protein
MAQHPDDVEIDYKTGEVRINGPVMTEQKEAREMALYNKKKFEKDLKICTAAMGANPDNLEAAQGTQETHESCRLAEKRGAVYGVRRVVGHL